MVKRAAPFRGRPASRARGRALPDLDAAAGDLAGNDPYVDLTLAAGPRPHHGVLLQAAQLGRMGDMMRRAAHQHAPPLTERLVDVVDLDRDLAVGMPVDDRALGRPDHDGVG